MLDGLVYRGAAVRLGSRYRTVGGGRMHERYFESEAAPVLVLVHGIGVSSRYFLPTAGRLAERCTVYAPDLPGFGLSAPLGVRPTVRRLADAFAGWLPGARPLRPPARRGARSPGREAAGLALDSVREPVGLLALETFDYVQHIRKSGIGAFV